MQLPSALQSVPWWQLCVLLAALLAAVVVVRLARPGGRWGLVLRRRFVMGVPWGTLLVIAAVLAVYLFVQGGFWRWRAPVVIPFRAWSYYYPLGMLTAGVAHTGASHLTGNLLGTLVFGSVAEYVWGHFPRERGTSSFSSLRTNPFARIGAFVAVSMALAVLSSLFSLGPVIGFSSVVFAYAGFALVGAPVLTLVAVLSGSVLGLVYNALQRPVVPGMTEPSFGAPWWASIAIQGHALGLFMGVLLAVAFVRRRGTTPDPLSLFVALVAFGADRGLWAIYAFLGNNRFELYRAGGVAMLFVMAGLVTAAATASRRALVRAIDLRSHEAAVGLTLAVLVALSAAAVPYNLLAVGAGESVPPEGSVEVRDYTVFYSENVTDRLVSAVDLPGLNTEIRTSGVIVVSDEREVFWTAHGKRELAFGGERRVRLGGLGWRETVVVNRTGWTAAGGEAAYRISLGERGGEPTVAYLSPDATAEPRIGGRNVSVRPTGERFYLIVTSGNVTLDYAAMPGVNESVTAGGLTFERIDRRVFAVDNGTRVRVATRETYR